jgi:arginyl-tRNA synthetase
MVFNPEESIDFHGNTGPFIQYTYARTRSVLRKVGEVAGAEMGASDNLFPLEKQLLVHLEKFPCSVAEACAQMDPSVVANYVYNLAKMYNSFYTEHKVANAESGQKKALRLAMCHLTATVIKNGMGLLGIQVPERM